MIFLQRFKKLLTKKSFYFKAPYRSYAQDDLVHYEILHKDNLSQRRASILKPKLSHPPLVSSPRSPTFSARQTDQTLLVSPQQKILASPSLETIHSSEENTFGKFLQVFGFNLNVRSLSRFLGNLNKPIGAKESKLKCFTDVN